MTQMIRFDPLADLNHMNRVMNRFFGPLPAQNRALNADRLPVDIFEKDDALVLQAPVPGVNPDDVEVTFQEDVLTIKGETKNEYQDENHHRRELSWGVFERSIRLPVGMQIDKAEASFNNGMLTVTIPLPEKIQPRRLKINIAE